MFFKNATKPSPTPPSEARPRSLQQDGSKKPRWGLFGLPSARAAFLGPNCRGVGPPCGEVPRRLLSAPAAASPARQLLRCLSAQRRRLSSSAGSSAAILWFCATPSSREHVCFSPAFQNVSISLTIVTSNAGPPHARSAVVSGAISSGS